MKLIFKMLITCLAVGQTYAQQVNIGSPNGHIQVSIQHENKLQLAISLNGEILVKKLSPNMVLDNDKVFGANNKLVDMINSQVDDTIHATIPTKSELIRDHYNIQTLIFEDFYFEVRAYDNGVAYRFESKLKDEEVKVMEEGMDVTFDQDFQCYFPEEEKLISHFENYYEKMPVSKIATGAMGALPTLFTDENGISVSITEADLYDYPHLLIKKKNGLSFGSLFPRYVLKTQDLPEGKDRLEAIEKEAPYIAKVGGSRHFPWRLFMISENDKQIIENNLVYQLASPLKLEDYSWIKPGKVAWDWWNANNMYGVDFKSGLNTETYKYYIDFAAMYGLEYIIMDEGWSKSTLNVMEANSDIDMETLTSYARNKGVGIILWSLWRPMDKNMDRLLEQYEKWGIKGIKVDFIQRADQYVVDFYERLAKKAAEHHILVDYHGGPKPAGMRRGYPNIINYEGVKGLENNKWEAKITPEHDLTLPFTRMTAGIMDYTPGGMDNAHKNNFAVRFDRPMTLGTRTHQMALYVVYEAPLQMLADAPSNYYRETESTEFISRIPTTWDETKVLEAKISDYVLIARKNGENWYVGGLTDENPRNFTLNFSFLDKGDEYTLEWFQDGVNSDRVAKDYRKDEMTVTADSKMDIAIHSGGGWVGIISKK